MVHPSRRISYEEVLSLICALLFTGIFTVWMLYLRQAGFAEHGFGVLVEYQEIIPALRLSQDSSPVQNARPRQQKPHTIFLPPVATVTRIDSPETQYATSNQQRDEVLGPDSTSAVVLPPPVSVITKPGPMLRDATRSTILDSIFALDPTTRQALLHQHFNHSSAIYDTATVLHLTRLSNTFLRFDDRPVSLEETMRLNIRRYGFPYDPNRPQTPSAQIPLGGFVSRVLDFIF